MLVEKVETRIWDVLHHHHLLHWAFRATWIRNSWPSKRRKGRKEWNSASRAGVITLKSSVHAKWNLKKTKKEHFL